MLVFRPSSHPLAALFCKFIGRHILKGTAEPLVAGFVAGSFGYFFSFITAASVLIGVALLF
jgi:hypothetical protein